ncbi:MAG TPA: hypothetical protein DIS88_07610, partial [Prevotella sp.]|nr:hypothetical protein [Prevotella sp.]
AWMHANVIPLDERNMNMAKKDPNIYAAIALALHEFKGNNVHDKESGIITIKPRHTLWNAKFLSMTPKPSKA